MLYRLIAQRLPESTIVSIGHRSTLQAFHQRHVAMTQGSDGRVLVEQSGSVSVG